MATVKHYGVTMRVELNSFAGCCGGRTLYGFVVEGNTPNLTLEQKEKMYDDLWVEMGGNAAPGTIVAMDAILDFGEWEDLGRSGGTAGSRWVTGAGHAGDISLEDFCRYHKFEFVGQSVNQNSGNIVCAMVKAVRAANESGSDVDDVTVYHVKRPDFSDDETATKGSADSGDVASVIASLQEAIARSQNAA